MATYILLSTLTESGAELIKKNPGRIRDANRDMEALGVEIVAQYAVLGSYDFVTIVEAPDNRTIVRVSTELSLRGNLKITTLPALPIEEFIAEIRQG
jgi:uncharacterized protein with GYD domain